MSRKKSFCGTTSSRLRKFAQSARNRPAETIFWTIRVRLLQFWSPRSGPKLAERCPDCPEKSSCGAISSRLRKFAQSVRKRPAETFFWTIRTMLCQFWPTRSGLKLTEPCPDCPEKSFCGVISSRLLKFAQSSRKRSTETIFWTIRTKLFQFWYPPSGLKLAEPYPDCLQKLLSGQSGQNSVNSGLLGVGQNWRSFALVVLKKPGRSPVGFRMSPVEARKNLEEARKKPGTARKEPGRIPE